MRYAVTLGLLAFNSAYLHVSKTRPYFSTPSFQESDLITFGYLIPITPREMPFGLDALDAKDRPSMSQNKARKFGFAKSRKKA